jgi:hypothetical protein
MPQHVLPHPTETDGASGQDEQPTTRRRETSRAPAVATVATEPGSTSTAMPSQASTSQIPNRPKTIPARGTKEGGEDEAEDTEEEEDEDEEYGGIGMEQLVLRVDAFLTGSGDPERNKERIRQLAEDAVAHGPPHWREH